MSDIQTLTEKWAPVLDDKGFTPLQNQQRRDFVAQILENQQAELIAHKRKQGLTESTTTANISTFDPVIISTARQAMGGLIAHDLCGVQAMSMPTGLVFALRAYYGDRNGGEALFQKAKVNYSGDKSKNSDDYDNGAKNPFKSGQLTADLIGSSVATATAENSTDWAEMSAYLDKVQVVAGTRQLKTKFSPELVTDWNKIVGTDVRATLATIAGREILTELNQEIVRTLYNVAVPGAVSAGTPGTFNLRTDSDGRWAVERYKGLLIQIQKEANKIAIDTRRGIGNVLVASADVVSGLQMAGILDFAPALNAMMAGFNTEMTGTTYAGNIGRMRVYIDPYLQHDGFLVGYKGADQYDAGYFYCPYIPLQPLDGVDTSDFHFVSGFKTRYGVATNPLVGDKTEADKNFYYRKVAVEL